MVKLLAVVVSVLLVAALLGGCGAATISEDHNDVTTTAFIEKGSGTVTEERTTATESSPSTAKSSQQTRSTAPSISKSTTATTMSTTASTAAPTVHTLTPLASSSYYGLSELKRLSNGAALTKVYEKIVTAVQNCQTTVALDETLTKEELVTVFYYYYADYPQHFWCDGNIRYIISKSSKKVTQIQLNYTMTGDELLQAQTAFNKAVVELLEIAATGKNEFERELLLHDALAKRVTYQEGSNAHNSYGALVNGKAVCEGYARAFQYLLYQSGIQCLIAEGTSISPFTGLSEGHAWNVVRIDGQYYHIDPTWDDTDDADTPVIYAYFNVTTAQIKEDHTISSEDHYTLPGCVATADNYHVKNGTRLTVYTVDGVARILNKSGATHIYCVGGDKSFVDWFNTNHNAVLRAMGIYHSYSFDILYTANEVVVRLKT